MREYVVRQFFEGEYGPSDFRRDYPGTVTRQESASHEVQHFHFEALGASFIVEPRHIVKLIDATLNEGLDLEIVRTIASWLDADPHSTFDWDTDSPDGKRVSDSVFWLGTPEVNYPLTSDVLKKIRHYLVSGENQLTLADAKSGKAGA